MPILAYSAHRFQVPNLTLINNALQQTGWDGEPLTKHSWRPAVRRRLEDVAWEQIVLDASPFLEPTADSSLLTRENLLHVLVGD